MTRFIIIAATLVAAVGCGTIDIDEWGEEAAKVSCDTLKRCDPITFHRDYGSVSACIASTVTGNYSDCTFDDVAAEQCLDAMSWGCKKIGRQYDELLVRCDAVWTCQLDTSDTADPLAPL